ncbi:MAG TPA: twin-arginine translocation signal domain-containing protein [Thermodesulfobacteriota bacterium]|nr:twin-arginine translocation signal domain-containing protein [Thermodesulfobacteriota bacterium]
MSPRIVTRRDFLRGAAGATIAAAVGFGVRGEAPAQEKAKVVLIRNADVFDQSTPRENVLASMLDEAVKTLLDAPDAAQAWRKLFQPSDLVGVKTNAWARMPTPKELERAIKSRLLAAGIKEENLEIADRGVHSNPFFQKATALLNVRPLRTHHWSSVGSCIKNYIQFIPNPSAYHPDGCSALGEIWTLPIVKGKTRLNVLSVLNPQFYGRGANFFDTRYLWQYKGLIVGTDVVAVDAVGAELLKAKRIAFFGEDRALDAPPVHISVADKKYHLGVSDLDRIQIVKLGWMEDVLI